MNHLRTLIVAMGGGGGMGAPLRIADMIGQTMNDASGTSVNVGTERSDPVFSDKEWRQGMLWGQADSARLLATGDPARMQSYLTAEQAYEASLTDPGLPDNRRRARLAAADARVPGDADVMMRAVEGRQRKGRGK